MTKTKKRYVQLTLVPLAIGVVMLALEVFIKVRGHRQIDLINWTIGVAIVSVAIRDLIACLRSKEASMDIPLDIMRRSISRLIDEAKAAQDVKERDLNLEIVVAIWGIGQGFSEEALLSLSPEFVDLMIEIAEKKADLKERFWIDLLRQRREEFRHLPLPEGRGVTTGT